MNHQAVVWSQQVLIAKSGILESSLSSVDIAMHCYGMKKELGPIHVAKTHPLKCVVKIKNLVHQQGQDLLLSLNNF
jgi:hypothetical protein